MLLPWFLRFCSFSWSCCYLKRPSGIVLKYRKAAIFPAEKIHMSGNGMEWTVPFNSVRVTSLRGPVPLHCDVEITQVLSGRVALPSLAFPSCLQVHPLLPSAHWAVVPQTTWRSLQPMPPCSKNLEVITGFCVPGLYEYPSVSLRGNESWQPVSSFLSQMPVLGISPPNGSLALGSGGPASKAWLCLADRRWGWASVRACVPKCSQTSWQINLNSPRVSPHRLESQQPNVIACSKALMLFSELGSRGLSLSRHSQRPVPVLAFTEFLAWLLKTILPAVLFNRRTTK